MIKKVGELNTAIETLQGQINDLDERVEELEIKGTTDHLEDRDII
jgi:chaperonin cofactor prefoldin